MNLIIDLIVNGGQWPQFNSFLTAFIYYFSQVIAILFCIFYIHQVVYIVLGCFKHVKIASRKEVKKHRYGIVISARNESVVIANLIKSIRDNDYPQELIQIFVIADNCTDDTAEICRKLGCIVFERFDEKKIGKGFALHYLFSKLHTDPQYSEKVPEAYIVVDADNLLKNNFITEMNKAYDSGYEVVTSYRNTKNFGKNWLTSSYGYWFMHEARHLNNGRMIFKNSCRVMGTGFLVDTNVVKEYDNWNFFALTEDLEFTVEYILSGRKIGYCSTAEFFDEQPEKFRQAWRQRERWAKGLYQVMAKKGGKLLKGAFKGNFSCWDIFTSEIAAFVLMIVNLVVYLIATVVGLCMLDFASVLYILQAFALNLLLPMVGLLFVLGLLLCITEWRKLGMPAWKKIAYTFTFPLFMLTYIPIALSAIFKKVKWKPIEHKSNRTLEEVEVEVAENSATIKEIIKKKKEESSGECTVEAEVAATDASDQEEKE